MDRAFYIGNRQRLAALLAPGDAALLFSGNDLHRSADAYHLFQADRNFVYLTGISQKQSALLLCKDSLGTVSETLYLLPKDAMAERWTGQGLWLPWMKSAPICGTAAPTTSAGTSMI